VQNAPRIDDLKQQLVSLAGSKGGLDMTEEAKVPVVELLNKFGEVESARESLELAGTRWKQLFTNSTSALLAPLHLPAHRISMCERMQSCHPAPRWNLQRSGQAPGLRLCAMPLLRPA
jgi:hypothetical protein